MTPVCAEMISYLLMGNTACGVHPAHFLDGNPGKPGVMMFLPGPEPATTTPFEHHVFVV